MANNARLIDPGVETSLAELVMENCCVEVEAENSCGVAVGEPSVGGSLVVDVVIEVLATTMAATTEGDDMGDGTGIDESATIPPLPPVLPPDEEVVEETKGPSVELPPAVLVEGVLLNEESKVPPAPPSDPEVPLAAVVALALRLLMVDVLPDVVPDVVPEVVPDVVPDVAPEVVSDIVPEVPPSVALRVLTMNELAPDTLMTFDVVELPLVVVVVEVVGVPSATHPMPASSTRCARNPMPMLRQPLTSLEDARACAAGAKYPAPP